MQKPFTFTNQSASEWGFVGNTTQKGSPSRRMAVGNFRLTYLICWQQAIGAVCLLAGLLIFSLTASAQRGTVFRDFNGNGTRDTNEPLVSGILVKAYNTAGALCASATSAGTTAPNYTLPSTCSGQVRVEFSIPATGNCVNSGIDFSSASGSVYGSSVQFVTATASNVNFAVHNPADYNTGTTGVNVFIPCYISGDPLPANSPSGALDWFVGYPYTNSTPNPGGSNPVSKPPTQKLNGAIIGATWGVAYSKQAKKVFTSALLKRHVGLGTLGSGGIYMLTPAATSFTVNSFYDMDANGNRTRAAASAPAYGEGTSYAIASDNSTITYLGATDALTGKPSGLGVIGTNTERDLSTGIEIPSYDPASFDQIGKVGLGDMDISDDGKYLFVMNLYSRKVFRLELNDAYNPTSVVSVTSYDVPATTCTNGEYRPWGMKFYRDKLYVGVVCSGENGGTTANLTASVYELTNPTASATFNSTALLTIPLNYSKSGSYNPWTHNSGSVTGTTYPQPILSDIEITDNGDMVLGVMDRAGNQWGENNRKYLKSNTGSITLSTSGDILVGGFNCNSGAFTLENNGTVTSATGAVLTGSSTNTGEGPGGKEFFNDNSNVGDPHKETATGGLAVLKGQGEVLTSAFAQDKNSGDGGTLKLSTTDGSYVDYYELYNRTTFNGILAKANGLGDVELSAIEAPIEIGNRVWKDTNNDGLQDAGEAGIDGVTVQLYQGATLVASTNTANGGQYYFNSTTTAGLLPNTAYTIKLGGTLGSGPLAGCTGYSPLNTALAGNDANASGVVSVSTGNYGENNHTYDIGLVAASCAISTTVTQPVCNSATNQYVLNGTISLTANTAGGMATITDGAKSTTVTVAVSATSVAYSLAGLVSGTGSHTVTVSLAGCGSAVATYSAPASCTVAPPALAVVVGTPVCNSATNNYTATGTVSLTNAVASTLTITDNGTTIGTISVTAGQTTASFSVSGVSNASSHTVTATLTGGTSAKGTYTAPAACTVCSTSITTSALANGQVGTAYSQTIATTGGTPPLTFSSVGTLPAGLSLNTTSGVISGTPTAAATSSFTIKVTDSKSCSDTQPLTITTSSAPVCSLTATATPTVCNSATNQYSVSGTITLTNNTAGGTATITDGGKSTTVTAAASATSVAYSLMLRRVC